MRPSIQRAVSLSITLLIVIGISCSYPQFVTQSPQQGIDPVPQARHDITVDNLPVLSISTPSEIPDEPKVTCTVQMSAPKGFEKWNTNVLTAAIEVRGGVSRQYPKKSYALELEQSTQLLDMRTDDDWILNAAYIDISLMRHKLSFDLFRSLSTESEKRFAVASRFIEVYLNGTYHGVYLLMERVDAKLLQFTPYMPDDKNHGCIYKAVNHSANFHELGHWGYRQKEPHPRDLTYWKPMDDFNQFVIETPGSRFFHSKTGIASQLDLLNAIDFHLLVLVTSNYDGITKNFYFCRDGGDLRRSAQRFFFVPWDYDGSFGRDWHGGKKGHTDWMTNYLFDRLLKNKTYRGLFKSRWNALYRNQFSPDTIHRLIDENVEILGPATDRNFNRWPTYGHRDVLHFDKEMVYIKSWVARRLKWLNREINGR